MDSITRLQDILCIGLIFSFDRKLINHRTWRMILLNPFLRIFGWQIVSVWRDMEQWSEQEGHPHWYQLCRCTAQPNLLRNLRESWAYDLGNGSLWRWHGSGVHVHRLD